MIELENITQHCCLVGPVLAVLSAGAVVGTCHEAGVPSVMASPLCVTTVLLVVLTTPPGLKEWRLTGKHRIVPGPQVEGPHSEFVKVG